MSLFWCCTYIVNSRYFKNDTGTVVLNGNKVITETRFSKTTIEVKAVKYVKNYYLMEVAALKQLDKK